MQRYFAFVDGRIEQTVEGAQGPIRVFINPTEEERAFLTDKMGIDAHTLASALDPDELARLEFEPDHIALIFKRPKSYTADDQFCVQNAFDRVLHVSRKSW
jgi:magnesium transporter